MKGVKTKANESKIDSVLAHKLLIYINNQPFPITFSTKHLRGFEKHSTFAHVIKRVTPQDNKIEQVSRFFI